MSLRKSSRRRNGSKSDVFPNPKARFSRTPAPSSVGLDLLRRLIGRIDILASNAFVRFSAINLRNHAMKKKREYGTNGKERNRLNKVWIPPFSVYSVAFRLFR